MSFGGEMEEIKFSHIPVMLNECISSLNIKSNGIYVDGTLGGGGHSQHILSKLTTGMLIGVDKDDYALNYCKNKFLGNKNIVFVKSDFVDLPNVVNKLNIGGVDGILLDLGVSSYQIDTPERGFSYRFDAPLDMRMDLSGTLTAYNVVNEYSEEDLLYILYNYGEEVHAKLIVKGILQARQIKPIKTTMELVNIIENSVPKKFWGKGSMAKKTFQAIRIEVNGELKNLERAVRQCIDLLNKNGRLVIITFHSLEDRIVKNVFKECATNCMCDKQLPVCICGHKASVKLVTRKPLVATSDELKLNKRSSSAKVRVIEKL